jgi:hypothetical protein
MNSLVTREMAQRAFHQARPLIMEMFDKGHTKRKTVHIVVKVTDGIEGTTFGDTKDTWQRPYDEIATAKLELSATIQMNTYDARSKPGLLSPGDIKYGGGVYLDGIVVAASAVEPWNDEFFATVVAAGIRAQLRRLVEEALADDNRMHF